MKRVKIEKNDSYKIQLLFELISMRLVEKKIVDRIGVVDKEGVLICFDKVNGIRRYYERIENIVSSFQLIFDFTSSSYFDMKIKMISHGECCEKEHIFNLLRKDELVIIYDYIPWFDGERAKLTPNLFKQNHGFETKILALLYHVPLNYAVYHGWEMDIGGYKKMMPKNTDIIAKNLYKILRRIK